MNRRALGVALSAALLMSSAVLPIGAAGAITDAGIGPAISAGYGEADATWHVGAGAGQYTDKWPDIAFGLAGGEFDPHNHSTTQQDSYGVQSRLSFRAIVVDDGEDQVALMKSDNYVAMDAVVRRAGQILATEGSDISYDEIFHMGSHNHFSPMYSTTSWGVWLFQDVFDIRAFEYQARQMAAAILEAEANLVPAKMGATTVQHHLFKGMVARRTIADDGTPAGYPLDFGDFGVSVVRFDTLDGGPIATLVSWGMHPEGLEGDNLITAEWLGGVERFVGRATGGGVVIGQGDVGSSESGPSRPYEFPEGIFRQWDNAGHAQAERGAWLLSQDVIRAWNQIGSGTPPAQEGLNDPDGSFLPPQHWVPFTSEFDVEAGNAWIPGPVSHPYPSVWNCKTRKHATGEIEGPGLPTCGDILDEFRNAGVPVPEFEGDPMLQEAYDQLKGAGVPIADHIPGPGFGAVQENLRLHLQAFKLGDVILMSCACEAQVDLVLNLETRTDNIEDNMWLGYDWTKRLDCTQAESDPEGDWTCVRRPDDPAAPRATFTDPIVMSNAKYEHMLAQIYNDAGADGGWDAPENAVAANDEPENPKAIWGNFTHEELPADGGYKLPIAFGNTGDYNGYTVSYREYMAYDHYRKALTPYGPHSADYMNTRLTRLAGHLNGGLPLAPEPLDALAQVDEARQVAWTTALGTLSSNVYDTWRAALPNDLGPAAVTTQPGDIRRFDSTTVVWRGGSNAVDNPTVGVERLVEGGWVPFADQSGEIQTKVKFPQGVNGLADTYRGAKEWLWTANFEAFNAFPAGIGSTPEGQYRFVVDGLSRQNRSDTPYHLESESFTVSPWDGLKVQDLRLEDDGSISFTVDSTYPELDEDAAFPYVRRHVRREADRGELRDEEIRSWCDTCSFRPWATSGEIVSATVTVVRAGAASKGRSDHGSNGTVSTVTAQLGPDGRWYAPAGLRPPDAAIILPGAIVDSYGETNRECFGDQILCASFTSSMGTEPV